MSRIEVDITGLQAAGGQASATGSRVAGLAADCHGLAAGGGAPPATASALASFASVWSAGLAALGDEISSVGMSADAAATLYQRADTGSMCPVED
ncbi:MAG TPA: hypothetical protein VFX51_19560 [Solirubrobacteraceae bacterium]|nr:hypothetical protein [Solirubrobacteraceae bacterium]